MKLIFCVWLCLVRSRGKQNNTNMHAPYMCVSVCIFIDFVPAVSGKTMKSLNRATDVLYMLAWDLVSVALALGYVVASASLPAQPQVH